MEKVTFHGGDDECGGVFVVETVLKAGDDLHSHQHKHGHVSVLVHGCVDVTVDGKTDRYFGYNTIVIPPGSTHGIHALTDALWLCLWSMDRVDMEDAEASKEELNSGRKDS